MSTDALQPFTMKGLPLLASGRKGSKLASAEQFTIQSRIYAEGGETTLHNHPDEDHAFYVLAGEATFFDQDETEHVVQANDGILIPRGVDYGFKRTGKDNLVLLRVGTGTQRSIGKIRDGEPVEGAGIGNGQFFGV